MQGDPQTCRSRRVAVIDDDAAVLHSLRFLLEVVGCEVATFASAAAFLAYDRAWPDCIVLDFHMPRMTGLDLIERLRADRRSGSRPDARIMLVTGSSTPALKARAAALGVTVVAEKPPAEADLLAFVGVCG